MKSQEVSEADGTKLLHYLWEKMYFRKLWVLSLGCFLAAVFYESAIQTMSAKLIVGPFIAVLAIPVLNLVFYLLTWIKSVIDSNTETKKMSKDLDKRAQAYSELERAKKLFDSGVIDENEYDIIVAENKSKITGH